MLLKVANEAVQEGVSVAGTPSQVLFGDRAWEAMLLIQQDRIHCTGRSTVSLGHVILARLVERSRQRDAAYVARLRRVLTVGLAPLFSSIDRAFTEMTYDTLAVVYTAYPNAKQETLSRLSMDVLIKMDDANTAWQILFQRELAGAGLTRGDRRFVLCVLMVAIQREEHLLAMQASSRSQENDASQGDEQSASHTQRGRAVAGKPSPARWTLSDIGGCQEAKRRIGELAWLLTKPEVAAQWGRAVPVGTLLTGPPGNGKTMLAHALARHTKKKLYTVSMADLFTLWYGMSTKNLRAWFQAVRKTGGVLFFDEADGLLSSRTRSNAHEETGRVINEFCVQMDQLPRDGSVAVVLATNFKDRLDDAAIRAKRIDLVIPLGKPSEDERLEILNVHITSAEKQAERSLFADTVDVAALAAITSGLSGADLAAIVDAVLLEKSVLHARSGTAPSIVSQQELMLAAGGQRAKRLAEEKRIGFSDTHSSAVHLA